MRFGKREVETSDTLFPRQGTYCLTRMRWTMLMRRAKTGYVCMYTSINIVSMCITFWGSPRGHAHGCGALRPNRIFWGMSRVLKHTSLTYKTFYRYIMILYVCLVLYVWGIHTYALEGFKHTYIHAWGLQTYIHTRLRASNIHTDMLEGLPRSCFKRQEPSSQFVCMYVWDIHT